MQNNIEKIIGYEFHDLSLLKKALTHSSFIKNTQNRIDQDNERLEFLGDAILDAVISLDLYSNHRMAGEGELTKTRARVVCEESLANIARNLSLGSYILMGEGEKRDGGMEKASILSDTLEAIIGAISIDGGFSKAQEFIHRYFQAPLSEAIERGSESDYKTAIQEYLQSEAIGDFKYRIVKEEGPAHAKTFYAELTIADKIAGRGVGQSKKEAEQNAAKAALEGRDNIVL